MIWIFKNRFLFMIYYSFHIWLIFLNILIKIEENFSEINVKVYNHISFTSHQLSIICWNNIRYDNCVEKSINMFLISYNNCVFHQNNESFILYKNYDLDNPLTYSSRQRISLLFYFKPFSGEKPIIS